MTDFSIEEWSQFIGTVAAIMAMPWLVDLIRYFFREKVVIDVRRIGTNMRSSATWKISARNMSKNAQQNLVAYARNSKAIVKSVKIITQKNGLDVSISNKETHCTITSHFWPNDRNIDFIMEFDKDTVPIFKAPGAQVKEVFQSPRKKVAGSEMTETARLRVVWILTNFISIGILALGRIAYLGST